MRISVFGLGYVGTVTAACLAKDGHTVIGVDPNQTKVNLINTGTSPVIEEGLSALIAEGVAIGRLEATVSAADAVRSTDVAFLCVGTPSQSNGDLDLTYLRRVCEEIGTELKEKDKAFTVVVRSTVLPGTLREVVIPTLETTSGKRLGEDFGVCNNPEFLREGTAVADYYQPPKIVIGASDDKARAVLGEIVSSIDAQVIHTTTDVAELVKYSDNAWHAVKVAFANEMGTLSKAHGIDGYELMNVFCADQKLNLSPYYLKPGFAFGGSCLPKDVRALDYIGRSLDLDLPLLRSVLRSNKRHLDRAIRMITALGKRPVTILGLSFKVGTDDLRESPMVDVVEHLIGKGYDIRIYDARVNLAKLMGANRDYILNQIPHISDLMVPTVTEAIAHGAILVVGMDDPEFGPHLTEIRSDQVVVDFARLAQRPGDGAEYDGICW